MKHDHAIAAVEFALIAPFLILLYLGSVDLTVGLSTDRKLTNLAGILTDLVARGAVDDVSDALVNDYFEAAIPIMRPHDPTITGMRITIATVDESGTASVIASMAANGMIARSVGESIEVPQYYIELASGNCLVVGEATYRHQPLFAMVFNGELNLTQRSISIPRFDSNACGAGTAVCAGYSGDVVQGYNCNAHTNSWGNGNGVGGGITNGPGRGNRPNR